MTQQATTRQALSRRLAELVESVCDGQVTAEDALRADSLVLIGVDSLASLRLIDAVEGEFGVPLQVEEDAAFLDSVAGLAAYLLEHAVAGGGEAPGTDRSNED